MNNTEIKNPQNCSLFAEIVKAYAEVNDAIENSKAWRKEANERMKSVNILIAAQRKIDPAAPDRAAFIEAVKAEYETPAEELPEADSEDTEADNTESPID